MKFIMFEIIFITIIVISLVVVTDIIMISHHHKPEDFPATAILDHECEHGHFYYDELNKCLYVLGFGFGNEIKSRIENVVKSSAFAEKMTSTYFLIDEKNRHIVFIKATKKEIQTAILDFDKLVGMEILQDGKVVYKKGVISGALIGGALFGGTGAILGGMAGDSTEGGEIFSYKIIFSVDDMKKPIIEFELLDESINMSSDLERLLFADIKAFGSKVKSAVGAVVENANKARAAKVEVTSPNTSVAEELQKLVTLKETGVLTEEEFNATKKKLLDL